MSVSKFLAGFVVGGAIGAIAGILLAPKSGEETRKILADTAQDMVRRADETAKQIQVKADDAVSDEAISEKDVPHGEEFHFEDAAKPVDLFEPKHGDKIEFPMIAESEDASDASLSFAKLSGLNDADNPESDPYNKPQS